MSTRAEFRIRRQQIAAEVSELDIDGKPRWTYAQIGKRNGGISRERVRQIQQEALIKLKRAMAARGVVRDSLL